MNIEEIKLMNNHVLVKPSTVMNEVIKFKSLELVFDSSFDIPRGAKVIVEIIKTPQKLIFGKNLKWKTEIEVQAGDIAWVSFQAILNAINIKDKSKTIIIEGQPYFIIRYSDIYVVKRKGKPIMVNGFCLIEPDVKKDSKSKNMIIKTSLNVNKNDHPSIRKYEKRTGTVAYIGKKNKSYLNPVKKEDWIDLEGETEIEVGDRVLLDKSVNIPLEFPGHTKFDGDRFFYVVQRRFILAKFKEKLDVI